MNRRLETWLAAHPLAETDLKPSVPATPTRTNDVYWLLDLAYGRPCYVCGNQGRCRHREPAVELALLKVEVESVC